MTVATRLKPKPGVVDEPQVEFRDLPFVLEENASNLAEGEVAGYASVFGVRDSYDSIWHAGVFKKSIREKGATGIRFLMAHSSSQILGKITELREDKKGLYFKAKISDTSLGRDVRTLLMDGAVDGVSIGFVTRKQTIDEDAKGNLTFNKLEVDLWEVSITPFPANERARVEAVREKWLEAGVEDPIEFHGKAEIRDDKLYAASQDGKITVIVDVPPCEACAKLNSTNAGTQTSESGQEEEENTSTKSLDGRESGADARLRARLLEAELVSIQ